MNNSRVAANAGNIVGDLISDREEMRRLMFSVVDRVKNGDDLTTLEPERSKELCALVAAIAETAGLNSLLLLMSNDALGSLFLFQQLVFAAYILGYRDGATPSVFRDAWKEGE